MRLITKSINPVASKTCCFRNCVESFPCEKISTFRKQVYQGKDWILKRHIQLDVHHWIHFNDIGNRVIILEGIDVCPRVWYLIHGIRKFTFHRHANKVENGTLVFLTLNTKIKVHLHQ